MLEDLIYYIKTSWNMHTCRCCLCQFKVLSPTHTPSPQWPVRNNYLHADPGQRERDNAIESSYVQMRIAIGRPPLPLPSTEAKSIMQKTLMDRQHIFIAPKVLDEVAPPPQFSPLPPATAKIQTPGARIQIRSNMQQINGSIASTLLRPRTTGATPSKSSCLLVYLGLLSLARVYAPPAPL